MMELEALEARHKLEVQELEEKSKAMFKGLSKKDRIIAEAQFIQMEFDLKARHRYEVDDLESQLEKISGLGVDGSEHTTSTSPLIKSDLHVDPEESKKAQILAKKAKSQRKKEKKSEKEVNRSEQLEQLKANAGTSLRDTELKSLNLLLKPLDLKESSTGSLSDIRNDFGENVSSGNDRQDDNEFIKLRKMAADYIRQNADDFVPFIGCTSAEDPEFDIYCRKVENVALAEWGGQLEIKALSECLQRSIFVYEANAPVVKMGEEFYNPHSPEQPIRLTYHKHYYALGEHYNSVTSLMD